MQHIERINTNRIYVINLITYFERIILLLGYILMNVARSLYNVWYLEINEQRNEKLYTCQFRKNVVLMKLSFYQTKDTPEPNFLPWKYTNTLTEYNKACCIMGKRKTGFLSWIIWYQFYQSVSRNGIYKKQTTYLLKANFIKKKLHSFKLFCRWLWLASYSSKR